ncbi:MAG: endonuclease/exonuclease/phosphatase family protein [Rhodothermales bacterium]
MESRRTLSLSISLSGPIGFCIGLVLCGVVGLAAATDAAGQDAEGRRVRVMTFNIHHGETMDGQVDLASIADVIRSSDADIVGLQEVDRHWSDRSAFADQLAALAELLDMYAVWGPIYNLPSAEHGRPNREYGLAIVSRFPVVEGENFELTRLPSIGTDPVRTVLPGFPAATLDLDGIHLHVYNVHLDYRSDPALRRLQAEEVIARVEQTSGPKVLIGDFNAPPEGPELAPIRERLRDAWDVAGRGDGYTFPADAPDRRIDHVYVTGGIGVVSVDVPETVASDHRPVVAELLLEDASDSATRDEDSKIGLAGRIGDVVPLRQAHAHNDYEHERPLFDALERGFRSIEADVHLVDGELLVAHDRPDVDPHRTLRSLYLDPLAERVRRNGGAVYHKERRGRRTSENERPLLLLVDVKSDAEATYRVLRETLRDYAHMLTLFSDDVRRDGAVSVVVSGNRARQMMRQEPARLAAYDGRPKDLVSDSHASPAFIPLISAPWTAVSTWRGEGAMPEADRERLRAMVRSAHAQGREIRFWATPDVLTVWRILDEEGVDLIGTDDLGALRTFLVPEARTTR